MATAKSLQKPKIIEIIGSTIRIAHPDVLGYIRTGLASQILAAGVTMTVHDNNGFADDDWMIVGEPGDNQTEEVDVNGTVTRGQSITVTNTLKFDHELDAPVTRILERRIRIFGAATDGGAGTLIASIDALAANAINIQWSRPYTEYNLISTDTAYAYYYVTFDDGTTQSSASDYVLAAGLLSASVERFITSALDVSNTRLDPTGKITREMCVRWANEAQDAIVQFMWAEPLSGRLRPKDWSFEIVRDITTLTLSENENEYALSGLSPVPKYTNTAQAIISVQLGDEDPLKRVPSMDMDKLLVNQHRTELSVQALAADTSITVDDTSSFSDSGTLYVGTDSGVTYTAKTSTTFTGIPASGTGSITATQAIDSIVLQGRGPGQPRKYCIDGGKIRFDVAADSTIAGVVIKIRYYKKLTALTSASSITDVSFTNAFSLFIASKMMARRGKLKEAEYFMKQFEDIVKNNAVADQVLSADSWSYHDFDSIGSLDVIRHDDDNPWW